MLKQIGLGIGVLAVAFVGFVATRPDTYHVERSLTMEAPAEVLFPYSNNLKMWNEWSPWREMDPESVLTFEGAEQGVTASYTWKGEKSGSGRMTILESVENQQINYNLEFIEPFASTASVSMAFAAEGSGTKLTWSMDGQNNFMGKLWGTFMDMDKMIGSDFEKGLNKLKGIAEPIAAAKKAEAEKLAAEQAAAAAMAGTTDGSAAAPAPEAAAAPAPEAAAPAPAAQ